MSDDDFDSSLHRRCAVARIQVPSAEQLAKLRRYYELLRTWNERINLTSLPLADYPPHTIDRLLIEPIAASAKVPAGATSWVDLGSGGGSPAVPMAITKPELRLTLTESRGKKAAFLREVVRSLRLGAEVLSGRFEDLLNSQSGSVDLITARAVRVEDIVELSTHLLSPSGRLLLFASSEVATPQGLRFIDRAPLPTDNAYLFQFGQG